MGTYLTKFENERMAKMNNEVAKQLRLLIKECGVNLCDDINRCRGLLLDLCGDNKKEVNLLLIGMESGAPNELMSLQDIPYELQRAKLMQKIIDDYAIIEEAALWSVESWAFALGLSETLPINIEQRGNTIGNIINEGYVTRQGKRVFICMDNHIYKAFNEESKCILVSDEFVSGNLNILGDWIYYNAPNDINRIRIDGSGHEKLSDDSSDYLNVVGDWIYYVNRDDDCSIYRIHLDGSGYEKLNDDFSSYMNVVDGWIYYVNSDDNNSIYRIRTDGSSQEKICDDESENLNASDGWIYYVNNSDSDKIYKVQTDGSSRIKLIDYKSEYLNVVNGWIYYENDEDDIFNRVKRVRTDGSEFSILCTEWKKIYNEEERNLILDKDWIYYQNMKDRNRLYKVHIDGSSKKKLNDDYSISLFKSGDWIFYINISDGDKIYKISTDGNERVKLNENQSSGFNLVNDWIYYSNRNDQDKLYKMRTDGSKQEKIYNDNVGWYDAVSDMLNYKKKGYSDWVYKICTVSHKCGKINFYDFEVLKNSLRREDGRKNKR